MHVRCYAIHIHKSKRNGEQQNSIALAPHAQKKNV